MDDAALHRCQNDGNLLRSYVERQVRLRKDGRNWKGLCPFHNEKDSSFTVYEDGHFHCYGCGKRGTVFDYVAFQHGIQIPEAIELVAREQGLPASERKAYWPRPDPKPNGAKPNGANGAHAETETWVPVVPPPPDALKP